MALNLASQIRAHTYLVLEEEGVEVGGQRRLVGHESVAGDEREEVRVVRLEERVRLARLGDEAGQRALHVALLRRRLLAHAHVVRHRLLVRRRPHVRVRICRTGGAEKF